MKKLIKFMLEHEFEIIFVILMLIFLIGSFLANKIYTLGDIGQIKCINTSNTK